MNETKYVMHRAPTYEHVDGEWTIVNVRYFPLMKPCVEFAKKQMKKCGYSGYSTQSLTREHVADLLTQHVPSTVWGSGE